MGGNFPFQCQLQSCKQTCQGWRKDNDPSSVGIDPGADLGRPIDLSHVRIELGVDLGRLICRVGYRKESASLLGFNPRKEADFSSAYFRMRENNSKKHLLPPNLHVNN